MKYAIILSALFMISLQAFADDAETEAGANAQGCEQAGPKQECPQARFPNRVSDNLAADRQVVDWIMNNGQGPAPSFGDSKTTY